MKAPKKKKLKCS